MVFIAVIIAGLATVLIITQFLKTDHSRVEIDAKINKLLSKQPVILVDAFNGKQIRNWQLSQGLKPTNMALIHAHTSKQNISPSMPKLEIHFAGSITNSINVKLLVDYQRGNGARKSRTTENDIVAIPSDGSFRNLERNAWRIHEDPDFVNEISQHGFFGGDAILTYQIEGAREEKIRFRIGGENPDDKACTEFIRSFPEASPGGKLAFMCAIARHESKHKNRKNVFYNQFLQLRTHRQKGGFPTWNSDGGSAPGGYGVFQVTGTDEDPQANIPRDQIWNWQSNVSAAFGIMTHQFKGSLANRYFNRIKRKVPQAERLFEQCPPPKITVAGETFTARQAVWITAYNGWGGVLRNRFVFSKNNPCGLGPGKRWYWNPPVKPNGKTYLRLIAEEMKY